MNHLFSDLFIFEMANNHQGSLAHGLRLVQAMGAVARARGINAGVKFQYRDLETFIHPRYRERTDLPHIPRFLSTRLSDGEFRVLAGAVRDEGMVTVSTPFDEPSVKLAADHEIQILKVASCSADDWPLLEAVAAAKKPVIVSTGGLSLRDIDSLANFLSHRDVDHALLHCVAVYPSPHHLLHLNFLSRLIRRYPGVPIGYSGHEAPEDTDVVKMAVAKGASILERHVGIPGETMPLNQYSLTPGQADAWVEAAMTARAICGNGEIRETHAEERASLGSLKRGVYAVRPIARGTPITRQDVMFAMPCADGQMTSGEYGQYRASFTATRDYARFDALFERSAPDVIGFARDLIHDAQGMIHEANIAVGDDVEVELSHHCGLAQFRKIGAIFITVVNREYCKRLVVILPGQTHPSHFHKTKEETFHLLWGDLEVGLNHRRVHMVHGDKLLIRPGVVHDFTSQRGAVFEEISTKNVKGDSYYVDQHIQRLDPIERKTILETW